MQFRGTIVETIGQGFWMDQWDLTQVSEWGRYTKCKPEKVKPPIEAQFCLCKT